MPRLLIWIALLAVAWWLLRSMAPATRSRPQIGRNRDGRRFGVKTDRAGADPADDLIACATCGVYLPRGRALTVAGELFCSEGCRDERHSADSGTDTDSRSPGQAR